MRISKFKYAAFCLFDIFLILLIIYLIFHQTTRSNDVQNGMKPICETISDDYVTISNNCDGGWERRIFFIDTSFRGGLNPRQACAIESTSRTNPLWDIYVFLSKPFPTEYEDITYTIMKSLKNVKLVNIDVKNYLRRENFESVFKKMETKKKFRRYHLADVLRMILLNKYGGLYLDLDVVVLKPFDLLPRNFVVRQGKSKMSSGIMRFSSDGVGKHFTNLAVQDLRVNFNPKGRMINGPVLVKRTLEQICDTANKSEWSAQSCFGIEVFNRQMFYPIRWKYWKIYYKTNKSPRRYVDGYMHHIWSALDYKYKVNKNALYAKLAKKYCPRVFATNQEEFRREKIYSLSEEDSV